MGNTDYNPYNKENDSRSSDRENDYDEKTRHKHGKPVNISYPSHSNSNTESGNMYCGTIDD